MLVYIVTTRICGSVSHIGSCGHPVSHEALFKSVRKLTHNKDTELMLVERGHIKLQRYSLLFLRTSFRVYYILSRQSYKRKVVCVP
jgi:hypothetical protein